MNYFTRIKLGSYSIFLPHITKKFWVVVRDFKDAFRENPSPELFDCAKQAMIPILPHSSADVERVFSAMNCAKKQTTKQFEDKFTECIIWINSKVTMLHAI